MFYVYKSETNLEGSKIYEYIRYKCLPGVAFKTEVFVHAMYVFFYTAYLT